MPDYKQEMYELLGEGVKLTEREQSIIDYINEITEDGKKSFADIDWIYKNRVDNAEINLRTLDSKYQAEREAEELYNKAVAECSKNEKAIKDKYDEAISKPANAKKNMAEWENQWKENYIGDVPEEGPGSLKEEYDLMMKEAEAKNITYKETERYKKYNFFQKKHLDGYNKNIQELKEIGDEDKYLEEAESEYTKAKAEIESKLQDANAELKKVTDPYDKEREQKRPGLEEKLQKEKTSYAELANIIKDYNTIQAKKSVAAVDDLTKEGKQSALDLLTDARAEYRNKLNGWQRMWANILPSWLYGNAKYVDKINAYKEVLKDSGFTDEQINDANPDKDSRYLYSKSKNKYFKTESSSVDIIDGGEEKLDDDGIETNQLEDDEPFLNNKGDEKKQQVVFNEKDQKDFTFTNEDVAKSSVNQKQVVQPGKNGPQIKADK